MLLLRDCRLSLTQLSVGRWAMGAKRSRESGIELENHVDVRLQQFMSWIVEKGGSFDGINIEAVGRGYGVFATRDFNVNLNANAKEEDHTKENQRFAKVPISCVLTAERALQSKIARSVLE